jgi:hypothetical protein
MAGPHAESAEKDLAVLEQRIQEKLKPHTAQLLGVLIDFPSLGVWRKSSRQSNGVALC